MSDIASIFPAEQVLTAADGQAYEESLHRWADNAVRRAKYVVFPKTSQDISKAITFTVQNGLDLAIKGGGHSASGASSSEGGLVIDLARYMNTVVVDVEKKLLTVGGGALWYDVDTAAAKYGLATVGGTVNHTGVGGLSVGGGFGWLTGKYGLTIDNIVQAEVVTASGEIVVCNETENADLFWGIRGGGSNFGVVAYFTFKAFPQPNPVWAGLLVYTPPQLEALIEAAAVWEKTATHDEAMLIFIACPPPSFEPGIAVLPFFNGSAEEARKRFKPILDLGPVADMAKEIPYEEMNGLQNAMATHGDRKIMKNIPVSGIDVKSMQDTFAEYSKFVAEYPDAKKSAVLLELHSYKKIVEVSNDAMAFSVRSPGYNMNFVMRWKDPALDSTVYSWASGLAAKIRERDQKQSSTGQDQRGYGNFGLGDERARDIFANNYDKLTEIKAKYDPHNVFNKWFPITPKTASA